MMPARVSLALFFLSAAALLCMVGGGLLSLMP